MVHRIRKFIAWTSLSALLIGTSSIAFAADASSPSDIENLAGFPGDSEVTLTWDPATDDTEVTGYLVHYGLSPVSGPGGTYDFGSEDVGDTTTAILDNLSNDLTYYFAVTAYDDAGNESENYSNEVDVTPESAQVGDFTAPNVASASALTTTLVEVEFSEGIELPMDAGTAFSIEGTDGTPLEVFDAYTGSDTSIAFVVTEEQIAGAQYVLTAGIDIMDIAGNPIESGTSDTAIFTGTSLAEAGTNDEPAADPSSLSNVSPGFVIDEVEVVDANELNIYFTEAIAIAGPDSFVIQRADDASMIIEVLAVSVDDADPMTVSLLTTEMDSGVDYILSIDDSVLNGNDESLSEDSREMEFTSLTLDIADLIAPEDITNLLSTLITEDTVRIYWTASVDTAGDLAKYLVYQSTEGGSAFGSAVTVARELTSYDANGLTPGGTYTFKVTAVDENGNESEGVLTTVTLPETGPGMIAMGALSFFGAGVVTRRKRRG